MLDARPSPKISICYSHGEQSKVLICFVPGLLQNFAQDNHISRYLTAVKCAKLRQLLTKELEITGYLLTRGNTKLSKPRQEWLYSQYNRGEIRQKLVSTPISQIQGTTRKSVFSLPGIIKDIYQNNNEKLCLALGERRYTHSTVLWNNLPRGQEMKGMTNEHESTSKHYLGWTVPAPIHNWGEWLFLTLGTTCPPLSQSLCKFLTELNRMCVRVGGDNFNSLARILHKIGKFLTTKYLELSEVPCLGSRFTK